jgi:hypothetical protein
VLLRLALFLASEGLLAAVNTRLKVFTRFFDLGQHGEASRQEVRGVIGADKVIGPEGSRGGAQKIQRGWINEVRRPKPPFLLASLFFFYLPSVSQVFLIHPTKLLHYWQVQPPRQTEGRLTWLKAVKQKAATRLCRRYEGIGAAVRTFLAGAALSIILCGVWWLPS